MIGHESVRAHNNGDCGSLCGICDFEDLQEEPELCECGKVLDSFGCKIRHLSIQHGWAKSDH